MEKRSALNFTLRIKAALFHKFLESVAARAYTIGYEAGKQGRSPDTGDVSIDPSQVRKLHP